MRITRARFDDVDEPSDDGLVGFGYRGHFYLYVDGAYSLQGRVYDDEPQLLSVLRPTDPTRERFGEEIPYVDATFARAIRGLLASSGVRRAELTGAGVDAATVPIELARLAGEARPGDHLFEPWVPVEDDAMRRGLELQLAREIGEGHVLNGARVRAIARRGGQR